MTTLERIISTRKLWTVTVDGVEPPSNDKLQFWCQRYSDAEIEHALLRATRKVSKGDVLSVTSEVERYMSGVLRHEAEKRCEVA